MENRIIKIKGERKLKERLVFLMLLTFLVTGTGCYYDKEELIYPKGTIDCNTQPATFTQVKGIMIGKCATAGCHNTATAAGNTILETYDQVKSKAAAINQRAIIEKTMPPGVPLSSNEISILKCWLNSNMPNN